MRSIGGKALLFMLFAAATEVVCFAQLFSVPTDSAAQVVSLTGQVSVLRDSEPWALNVGDKIQVQQVILTGPDGFAKFQVSDGSFFDVYPNSNVVFRRNPGNLRDLLELVVGRVKIHIQRWGGQPNPNRIMTPTAVIAVRGTTFDVSVDDDNETTMVAVEEGIVDVAHRLRPGKEKTLNAGETITVYANEPLSQSVIDKGALIQRVLHALANAVYTAATTPAGGSPGTTIPVGKLPGQTAPPPPPTTAPPPPPPSAPPPPPGS
jgi:hypothetical protein